MGPTRSIFSICRRAFCADLAQKRLFNTFMFINERYLFETRVQLIIHPFHNSGIFFVIFNSLGRIVPIDPIDLKVNFVLGYKPAEDQRPQIKQIL